ncbi:MAG: DHH family phosphoesterase [Candidatus Altiarchaeota archaeon]|nr:DHH family phosphoesterase [Candidatus Altiarchaeota archaeon]
MIKLHFHADCDGIVSAYFVSTELSRLKLKHSLHPSLGSKIEVEGKNNITLDLSLVKTTSNYNFSIDHHVSDRLNLIYANPRLAGFEWPVSFTTYALFGKLHDAWKSAFAVVADWGSERVPLKFWDVVKQQWPEFVPEINQKTLVQHKLGEMALMVDSHVSLNRSKGALEALSAIKEAKSPTEFLKGVGLAKNLKKSKEFILSEVDKALGNEVVKDKYILLEFSSPYRIKSLVSAFSKDKYPDKMIVIAQIEKDSVRLSFRNGDDLNTLVKQLTKGIGDGGGHPQASGGHVKLDKFDEFKSRLENLFS